ncbi:MAG: AgmX/PglI C-terminal domain-containing protein, partial [Nannocystaceae bacterium]
NALADILTVAEDGVKLQARSGMYMPVSDQTVATATKDSLDPDMAARQNGILGVMQQQEGQFMASPFGGAFAVGNDDEDVWGGLAGDEVGEAFGVGGLGLVGTGRGGGGTGEGTIGLGNTGLIGKGGGSGGSRNSQRQKSTQSARNSRDGTIGLGNTGLIGKGGGGGSGSGYGRGSGAGFGGRGKRVPKVRQAKAKVTGALDKDIIRRIVRAHINEVRHCYNLGLQKNPNLAGKVEIEFKIAASGKVLTSSTRRSSVADTKVSKCITNAVKRWKFPKPRGGGIVNVTYPFHLSPGSGGTIPNLNPYVPPVAPPQLTPEQLAAQQAAQAEAQRQAKIRAEAARQLQIQKAKEADERRRQQEIRREKERLEAERTKGSPYSGKLFDAMKLIEAQQPKQALELGLAWYDEEPGNVLALIAIGEALEASGDPKAAARIYGSLIDLFPSRADLRRYAGARLSKLGEVGLELAVDTFAQAVEQRPDHPGSHRMYAYALARVGRYEEAFDAIEKGELRSYPGGRFAGIIRILKDDLQILGAVWAHHQPEQRKAIEARLSKRGVAPETRPSLRFIMGWETDSNDVDFHIRDNQDGHAWYSNKTLSSGGELYADVTTGYGPECFAIHNKARAHGLRHGCSPSHGVRRQRHSQIRRPAVFDHERSCLPRLGKRRRPPALARLPVSQKPTPIAGWAFCICF